MASITIGELHLFHSIDRQIFSRLVISLKRQAYESLLIMALWLWLDHAKHTQITYNLTKVSNNLLDAFANEANLCINFLKSKTPPTNYDDNSILNLTSRIMNKEISIRILSNFKYTTISGVKSFLNEVCARAFSDILLQVLSLPSNFNPNTSPLIIPGFPDPTFGSLEIYALPCSATIASSGKWGWNNLNFEAPIDDRTIFLTFSRGFPVTEEEAKQFFIQMCGVDCIESLEMETNGDNPNVQSLYARMTLRSVVYMDQIMCGRHISKFRSKGKHIWARKFERREHAS